MKRPTAASREHLRRAALLATVAALDVLPDPPVGCVLVAPDGTVVGEGWHRFHGGPHAEAEALRAAGRKARGATAYVTLEPCGGEGGGKRTPACATALRKAGVAAVVYAVADPTPHAAGRGPSLLRKAGIAATRVACPEAGRSLRRWLPAAADPLPWTVAKWAMTLDGKIADARGGSRWISGEDSRLLARGMRAHADAVVVGARTAALDDPDLRSGPGGAGVRVPLRVVVDGALRLSPRSRLAATAREGPVLAAAGAGAPASRRAALEAAGVEVEAFPGERGRVDLVALFRALRKRGVRRVFLEGGGELHAAAFRAGLVRQAAVFVAPGILGGRSAPGPVAGEEGLATAAAPIGLEDMRIMRVGDDLLVEGFVRVG